MTNVIGLGVDIGGESVRIIGGWNNPPRESRENMSVYSEINPLISHRGKNERLIVQLSESLGRSVTFREFAIFVEYFNDRVISNADNLYSELMNEPELWLDSDNPEGYGVTE